MKMKTTIVLTFTLIVMMLALSACSSNKIPNGRYEPEDTSTTLYTQAIIINGNNFTLDMSLVGGITVKYSYNKKTGAITFIGEGGTGLTVSEYKDGSIWYGTTEFKKAN